MKLGIVGLPNVGKSTLFNSLTKAGAESANYPFCTIDPNVGVVTVPDDRLKALGEMYHSKKVTPAVIEFVDIAGLVKGASKGEGLGNQFLSNIREVARAPRRASLTARSVFSIVSHVERPSLTVCRDGTRHGSTYPPARGAQGRARTP